MDGVLLLALILTGLFLMMAIVIIIFGSGYKPGNGVVTTPPPSSPMPISRNPKCKHKFEPRYDEHTMDGVKYNLGEAQIYTEDLRRMMVREVYVCDICVKCGTKVERGHS